MVIPNSIAGRTVTGIGIAVFQRNTNLTSVSFPTGMLSIANGAFNLCSLLTNVAIVGATTNIGEGAFAQCAYLTNIFVSAANTAFCASNGVLFNRAKTVLFQCPAGKSGSYDIPDGVTRIVAMAFAGCRGLTNITLPNSVDEVGNVAFSSCVGLTHITVPAAVTNLGQRAFSFCTNMTCIYFSGNAPVVGMDVLTGDTQLVVHYLPGATGWPTAPETWQSQPTALWLPAVLEDEQMGFQENRFGFNLAWAAGKTVVVEQCTSLATSDWIPLQTSVLVGGTASFIDPTGANDSSRIYRLRSAY